MPPAVAPHPETLSLPARLDRLASGVFFVVGAPRSGTTLLQSMLSAHSRLHIPPETEFFMKFDPPPEGRDFGSPLWRGYLDRWFTTTAWRDQGLSESVFLTTLRETDASAGSVFLTLLALHASSSGKPRLGEKSPHHCRHVERIRRVLPQAKFIHIIRDPRDVVGSRLQVPWTRHSYLALARSWTQMLGEHERLKSVLPAECYTQVIFEELLAEPERELRRLCAFLGETFEPAMLEFNDRPDTGFTEREKSWKGETLQPLTKEAAGRWRQRLSDRQIAGVERHCGHIMPRYGYQLSGLPQRLAWRVSDAIDRVRDRLQTLTRSASKRLG